jgi:hypothetical protein
MRYPDSTRFEKMRRKSRALIHLPASLFQASNNKNTLALIEDISPTGMRVHCLSSFNNTTLIALVRFVPHMKTLMLNCRIVWRHQGHYGLEFIKLSKKERFLLKQLVNYHLLKTAQKKAA